jgi:hypothetical protein
VRVRWLGRRGLDLPLLLVLGDGVVQPREVVRVEDDLGVRYPGGQGARVNVPVHVQGKAVDHVPHADRTGAAGRIVTGVNAPQDLFRSGQLRRVGEVVDLVVGDYDEEVDVAPVIGFSATEGPDEPGGTDPRVSFETLDRPPEPCLANRTELWRCGDLGVGAHPSKYLTGGPISYLVRQVVRSKRANVA